MSWAFMNVMQSYTEEFSFEVIERVTERGDAITDVVTQVGVSSHSLYSKIECRGDGSDALSYYCRAMMLAFAARHVLPCISKTSN
jgi:transposase-like protein